MSAESAVSPVLSVRSLRVAHATGEVLRGVDVTVAPGEIVALMGVSGAGKSTLLRAVAALQPFSAGEIMVGEFALRPGPTPPESQLRPLRARVGMVFQAHSLFEHLSALDNVTLALMHVLRWTRPRAEEAARELLDLMGVGARAAALPRQLSGGEAQRVAIARALAPGPTLLLMDEPTAALDPARRATLGDTLRGLAGMGRALLVTTHDVDFARDHADRVVVLANGEMVEAGRARDVLDHPSHAATRQLLNTPNPGPDSGTSGG